MSNTELATVYAAIHIDKPERGCVRFALLQNSDLVLVDFALSIKSAFDSFLECCTPSTKTVISQIYFVF